MLGLKSRLESCRLQIWRGHRLSPKGCDGRAPETVVCAVCAARQLDVLWECTAGSDQRSVYNALSWVKMAVALGAWCPWTLTAESGPSTDECSASRSRWMPPKWIRDLGFTASALTPAPHASPAVCAVLLVRCLFLPGAARAAVSVPCMQSPPRREDWSLPYVNPATYFVLMFKPYVSFPSSTFGSQGAAGPDAWESSPVYWSFLSL